MEKKFLETSIFLNKKSALEALMLRETFLHSPRSSVKSAARQLDISVWTGHMGIRKRLKLYASKFQVVKASEPDVSPKRDLIIPIYREVKRDSQSLMFGMDLNTKSSFFTFVIYLGMLRNYVFPQLEELQSHVFLPS